MGSAWLSRRAIPFAGLAAAGVLIWWGSASTTEQGAARPDPISRETARDTEAEPPLARRGPTAPEAEPPMRDVWTAPGRWAVRYDARVTQQIAGDRRDAVARFDVTVDVAPAAHLGPGWVAGRLREARVDAEPALRVALGLDPETPTAGFERPFLLRRDPDRGVVEHRFHHLMPQAGEALAEALIQPLQVVRPRGTGGAGWSTREDSQNGEVEATYAATHSAVTKRWSHSEGSTGLFAAQQPPVRTRGETHWRLDARGLAAARFSGAFELVVAGGKAPAQRYAVEMTATVTRLSATPAVDTAWAETLALEGFEAPPRGLAPAERPEHPRVVRGESAGRLAASAPSELMVTAAEAAEAGNWELRRTAMRTLLARAEGDDAVVDDIEERLREALSEALDLRTLVEVLSSLSTPAGRRAFARTVGDPAVPSAHRQAAATAATFVPDPDAALIAALEEASLGAGFDDVATAALLALGGQARLLAADRPELAAAIRARLLVRATGVLLRGERGGAPATDLVDPGDAPPEVDVPAPAPAATLGEVMTWLDALGNVGGAPVWPLIAPWIGASDGRVRRIAVDNLRFVDTAEARLALATAMATDPDAWVRRAAVAAAQYQPQVVFEEPVLRVLESDPSGPVRLGAASALARWGIASPLLYDAIARAAEREPDPQRRTALLDLLPSQVDGTPGAP